MTSDGHLGERSAAHRANDRPRLFKAPGLEARASCSPGTPCFAFDYDFFFVPPPFFSTRSPPISVAQFACSNFISVELTDIVAALTSTAAIVLLLRVWQPSEPLILERIEPTGT